MHDKDDFYKKLPNIFSLRITNKDTYVDHDKENPIIKDEYFGRDKFSLDVEMDNKKYLIFIFIRLLSCMRKSNEFKDYPMI